MVKQVSVDDKECFEVQFVPSSTESRLVDIEYIEASTGLVQIHHNIPVNKTNTYHILLSGHANYLTEIKIREKSKDETGPWYSELLYARMADFNQSDLQIELFGTYELKIHEATPVDTLLGVYLHLEPEYLNQELEIEPRNIENYGWAIHLNYKRAKSLTLDIEFRFEDGDWESYAEHRDGKYDFIDMHGNDSHGGVDRNMKPGEYDVRLRYNDGSKSTDWLTAKVTIPNYVDN